MKKTIDFEFTEQKSDLKNNGNTINFRLLNLYEVDEQNIAKANLIECLQN